MATPGILAIAAPGSFIDDVDPDGRCLTAQADPDRSGSPSPVSDQQLREIGIQIRKH